MTKWEVLSDAIKIGLPSLITAVTAILITRATRSHELEKERLRRRQDALEKISADFEDSYFSMEDLLPSYHAYVNLWNDPAARPAASKGFWESFGRIETAIKNLYRIEGRLKLLQLKKSEEAFGNYLKQTVALKKMLRFPPDTNLPTKEALRAKFNEVKGLRSAAQRSFAEAFDSL